MRVVRAAAAAAADAAAVMLKDERGFDSRLLHVRRRLIDDTGKK
jgi:hypothetical protein